MWTVFPSYQFENILSPHFCIKLTEFLCGTEENYCKLALIPYKNCLSNYHFSPRLVDAYSKQCYFTSDLSELYVTSYH